MTLLHTIALLGVAVFAISGALAAGRRHFDLLGVVVIALVTATGGGTLRDILLDRHPVFWIADTTYVYVSLLAALLTVVYARWRHPPARLILIADALGLALFSISGAQIAEHAGHGGIVAVIMGTLTGAAGGVLRDMMCAEVPLILRRGRIYATAAIVGIAFYLLLQQFIDRTHAALLGMACIAALRLGAIFWNWTLPVFSLPGDKDEH